MCITGQQETALLWFMLRPLNDPSKQAAPLRDWEMMTPSPCVNKQVTQVGSVRGHRTAELWRWTKERADRLWALERQWVSEKERERQGKVEVVHLFLSSCSFCCPIGPGCYCLEATTWYFDLVQTPDQSNMSLTYPNIYSHAKCWLSLPFTLVTWCTWLTDQLASD